MEELNCSETQRGFHTSLGKAQPCTQVRMKRRCGASRLKKINRKIGTGRLHLGAADRAVGSYQGEGSGDEDGANSNYLT